VKDAKLTRRYADALYSSAAAAGEADEVVAALEEVVAPLADDRTFEAFWRGRRVPQPVKLELVDEVFAELPETLRRAMKLLLEKGREEILFDLPPVLRERHDRERGIVRATLATAIELSDEELAEVKGALAERFGSEVHLQVEVDEELVGGFRVRYGDRVLDASLARAFSDLRALLGA
jgi:F-type H+-transporting ATPase subunit delta